MPIDEDDPYAEERRVAHSELRAHAREIDRQNAIAFVLDDKNGRKAMWDLLSHCGVFSASFDQSMTRMSFMEGRRDVGIWLLAQLENDHPGAYALMSQEHQEREHRYDSIQAPRLEEDNE